MKSALGHCEDPNCCQSSSSNYELVRLFRCSIHCDRLLCLFHLNAHNVYYEEEKKQNLAILNELENNLKLYQTIFEQHMKSYRELVHQATTLLLQNKSTMLPIEQIRPTIEKLQQAIANFQQEKIIIKNESILNDTESDIDLNLLKVVSTMKNEVTPNKTSTESNQNVVVRLERIDYHKKIQLEHKLRDEQINKNQNQHESTNENFGNDISIESVSSVVDEDISHISKLRKSIDENQQQSRIISPASSKRLYCEKIKRKNEKVISLKRLQT